MKIAIAGKGGAGKTTVAALLARLFLKAGYKVLAIDADPSANLAAVLGFPDWEKIIPIMEMQDLIEEKTGASSGRPAPFFRMNPEVDDIPPRFIREHQGIKLLVMGGIKKGGAGCACPESVLLRRLIEHLLLHPEEVVIMDMEAGIEHLGRATVRAVDLLLVVVEPSRRSVEVGLKIKTLARDISLEKIVFVGNKIQKNKDIEFLQKLLMGEEIIGFIPYQKAVREADQDGLPYFPIEEGEKIYKELVRKYCSPIIKN